ncbi:hypothetical protein MPSEU_000869400 [Mayamaea pseudoterrestris]|nr:hypothetical protein MPSEU_000869400 [Mayamaea pseudoterrestris]
MAPQRALSHDGDEEACLLFWQSEPGACCKRMASSPKAKRLPANCGFQCDTKSVAINSSFSNHIMKPSKNSFKGKADEAAQTYAKPCKLVIRESLKMLVKAFPPRFAFMSHAHIRISSCSSICGVLLD